MFPLEAPKIFNAWNFEFRLRSFGLSHRLGLAIIGGIGTNFY